jgi:hypothetical protein
MVVADPLSAISQLPFLFSSTTKFISSGSTHVTAIGEKYELSMSLLRVLLVCLGWVSWCFPYALGHVSVFSHLFSTCFASGCSLGCFTSFRPCSDLSPLLILSLSNTPPPLTPSWDGRNILFSYSPAPGNGSDHRRPTPTHLLGLQNDLRNEQIWFCRTGKDARHVRISVTECVHFVCFVDMFVWGFFWCPEGVPHWVLKGFPSSSQCVLQSVPKIAS